MATEQRLIDANDLKKKLDGLEASGGHKYYRKGMNDTLHFHMPNIIDECPTVDAAPVVHGRWIADTPFCCSCSICNHARGGLAHEDGQNYCSNCGAKMDGDPHA